MTRGSGNSLLSDWLQAAARYLEEQMTDRLDQINDQVIVVAAEIRATVYDLARLDKEVQN